MARRFRRRYLVDAKVQGALALRAVTYWACCVATITVLLLSWRIIVSGPAHTLKDDLADVWYQFGPVLIVSVLMVPIIIFDCIRLTNRFAGPIYRLRRSLQELGQGKPVQPLKFREGDFWREMADEFNAVAARMQKLSVHSIHPADEDVLAGSGDKS
jgi:hypothetical protein